MTAADAWRPLPNRPMGRRWLTTWAQAVMSMTRAVRHAGVALVDAIVRGPTRVRCVIVGHVDRFSREPGRLALRCDECGRTTAGWAIGSVGPSVVPRAHRPSVARVAPRDGFRLTQEPFRLITPTRFR